MKKPETKVTTWGWCFNFNEHPAQNAFFGRMEIISHVHQFHDVQAYKLIEQNIEQSLLLVSV